MDVSQALGCICQIGLVCWQLKLVAMRIDTEIEFNILSYLKTRKDSNDIDATFSEIRDRIILLDPMLQSFRNPDFKNEAGRNSIDRDVKEAINALLERKFIIQLRIQIEGELQFVYHLSPDGESHYNSFVTFGRILQYDLDVFDMSLMYMPDYGEIDLGKISEIYADKRFFRVEMIERILLESGFASKIYNSSDYSKYSIHLTDKGRNLKKEGSLLNYYNFEKRINRNANHSNSC